MINRILAITKKETREILRDKRSLLIIFVLPVFLLIMFGYAVTLDIDEIKLGVLDNDRSPLSREFISTINSSEYFTIVSEIESDSEVNTLLNRGKIQCAVIIPSGFQKDIERKEKAQVQYLIDGMDASTASIIQSYVNAATQFFSQKVVQDFISSRTGMKIEEPLNIEPQFWYNKSLDTTQFFIPGLVAMILIVISVILVSISIVKEKELGTIEQIRVSPVSSFELIAGKIIPYLVVSLIIAALMVFMGYLFFGVTVKGSYFHLFLGTACYLLATLSMGIFISTLADSQQVAFQISQVVSQLPTVILSGFIFPIESMPLPIQILSNITPATYYIVVLRDIMIKGTPFSTFAMQILYLLIFATVLITISTIRIRRSQAI
ncbi:MAG: ABC transporter permease [Ignavibacteria bacterium]|nr:ABC transporter permease [Ignavibacteria bacterium]